MGHFEDADELVQYASTQFEEIKSAYEASLSDQEIKPQLLIGIKNLMENLRSALDFAAHGLYDKYGTPTARPPHVSFPHANASQSEAEFRRSGRVGRCIPGLSVSRPDIVEKLMSYQHFAGEHNAWLPTFMQLNNENKHQQLTPQIRKEMEQLRISSGGASVTIGPGASISVGTWATVRIGGLTIPGGQTFGVDRPPITLGPGKKERITWVSFHFSPTDTPVLPLLNQARDGVDRIVSELTDI